MYSYSQTNAVAPHIVIDAGRLPWASLSISLFVILVTGVLVSTISAFLALRTDLLPALKSE